MKNRTLKELNEIVVSSARWYSTSAGATVKLENQKEVLLSKVELELLDPRLPALLVGLSEESKQDEREGADGYAIYITLEYWKDFGYKFETTDGQVLAFAGLENIEASPDPAVMDVAAHVYSLLSELDVVIDGATRKLPYALSMHYDVFTVAREWLNQHCPGWEARLALADALGVDMMERHIYLMQSNPANGVDPAHLPDDISNHLSNDTP